LISRTPSGSGTNDEPIHPITRFTKRTEEAPFQPFIDYTTGKRYSRRTELYWKPLSSVILEYVNHPESKFANGKQTGKMKRRHLQVANVRYVGKETSEIEEDEVLGTSRDAYVEYGLH
jgi:hypothetical protein